MVIIPYSRWIMQYPVVLPKLYWGAISQEQRLAELAKRIAGLDAYMKYLSEAMNELADELQKELDEAIAEIKTAVDEAISNLDDSVTERIDELTRWVQEQTWSVQAWDVTRGLLTDSIDQSRRLFWDVTTEGCTVDELAENETYATVDELASSGYNVRAIAVIGARVLDIDTDYQWEFLS